ncbi:endonuclease MutS2 [Clostridium polynesiense]|uniref:endonuclease MutS2 n=1 Tax=Clostridium polynesiense TaxID=1325933 RepID=UPI0005902452|nr:endonuclease MutS2 [Clostridium polynesiense]
MNEKALKVLEFNKIKDKIAEYAVTETARSFITELSPYDNFHKVEKKLLETYEAFNLINKKGSPPFEGFFDVTEALKRAEKAGVLNASQLLRIGNAMKCSRKLKDFVARKESEEAFPTIEDICDSILPLRNLEDKIFKAIISEEEISDHASSTLYNIRRSLKEKNSSVRDKITSLVRSNSKYLQDNLFTVRGDRYVLPVRSEYKSAVPGLVHDQSSSGATLFIEPMSLVNLNNEIKELMLKEKAEIERILEELSMEIYNNITPVKNNTWILYELDFIFAKAKYANELNCEMPSISREGNIDLIEARHPLLDQSKVVPCSVYLGKDNNSLIITGPNTGGKTVTLKTVGLLHIMALSGVLIPVKKNSTIGYFNEVFADIGDEQSIEQSLSTFSSHMTNIVNIINSANEDSLVLLDELGAGTDPTEGAALAVAILEFLRKKQSKILATTHYSELKAYALRTSGVENASVEFDVETLRPTYRLLIGIPGKSNAFEISKRLGLPEYIIESSKELIADETLKFEDLIQSLQEKSIKAENDARLAKSLRLEADKIKEKLQVKLSGIDKIRENAQLEAKREAKNILREAKAEADEILKNIRELERMGYSSEARQKLEEERRKIKSNLDKIEVSEFNINKEEGKPLKEIFPGKTAFLSKLNQKVVILTSPDSKGEVQVQAGIMKINVKAKDLTESSDKEEVKSRSKKKINLNLKSTPTSIDLRGMDSEEAIYNTDKYLDEAYMAGLNEATVIHGKGTGVLRKAIQNMLKTHPHVKSYRLGEYGEGGDGVTVVILK